jgi:hypothetical protein
MCIQEWFEKIQPKNELLIASLPKNDIVIAPN